MCVCVSVCARVSVLISGRLFCAPGCHQQSCHYLRVLLANPPHPDILLPAPSDADVYAPAPFVLIYLIGCNVLHESTMQSDLTCWLLLRVELALALGILLGMENKTVWVPFSSSCQMTPGAVEAGNLAVCPLKDVLL